MQGTYAFAPTDEIMPPLWMTFILCFPCENSQKSEVTRILQQGLSLLVQERPFLAGVVKKRIFDNKNDSSDGARNGGLRLEVPPSPEETVKLNINDMTGPGSGWIDSYQDLREQGMPFSKMDGSRLSPVQHGLESAKNRVFEVQANFIPGGCLLSMSTIHQFVDSWGYYVIWEAWARCCHHVAQHDAASLPPPLTLDTGGHDGRPAALFPPPVSPDEYEALSKRAELWQLLGLDWRHLEAADGKRVPQPFSIPSDKRTCLFKLRPEGIEAIKRLATPEGSGSKTAWVSTKDALIAFMWRAITRARAPGWSRDRLEGQSMMSVAVDGRRALSPAVPLSHIGNVVFCCLTWQPVATLLADDDDDDTTGTSASLATLALAIRKSIQTKARDPQLLGDAVRLAAGIPDLTVNLGNAFTEWFGADLVTTAGSEIPFYDLAFPVLGRTDFFRMPAGQYDGLCILMPRHRDGSVDVFVSLLSEEMARLRSNAEFGRYLTFLCE